MVFAASCMGDEMNEMRCHKRMTQLVSSNRKISKTTKVVHFAASDGNSDKVQLQTGGSGGGFEGINCLLRFNLQK